MGIRSQRQGDDDFPYGEAAPVSYTHLEVLFPVILETQETLNRIKKDLDSLTQKAVRI